MVKYGKNNIKKRISEFANPFFLTYLQARIACKVLYTNGFVPTISKDSLPQDPVCNTGQNPFKFNFSHITEGF